MRVGRGKSKELLRCVDCTAEPSELTALMGPSGAGKTTLLNIMRGTAEGKVTAGEVLANGSPIDPHKLKLVSNLIPQDDVLFPSLTVRQQLHYAAQLRCSGTAEDRSNIVSELIARLSLTACADTLTGSTLVRGISGGQRKRLSIALELLTFPSVLFVDEPTSGLDSKTALDVMQVRSADLAPYRLWQHSQPRLPGSTPKRLVCRVAFAVRCAQSIAVQLLQELAHVEGIAVIAVIHQALICTALPSSSHSTPPMFPLALMCAPHAQLSMGRGRDAWACGASAPTGAAPTRSGFAFLQPSSKCFQLFDKLILLGAGAGALALTPISTGEIPARPDVPSRHSIVAAGHGPVRLPGPPELARRWASPGEPQHCGRARPSH